MNPGTQSSRTEDMKRLLSCVGRWKPARKGQPKKEHVKRGGAKLNAG